MKGNLIRPNERQLMKSENYANDGISVKNTLRSTISAIN